VGRLVCGRGEFQDVSGFATKWDLFANDSDDMELRLLLSFTDIRLWSPPFFIKDPHLILGILPLLTHPSPYYPVSGPLIIFSLPESHPV
jgi:hypothetical protein